MELTDREHRVVTNIWGEQTPANLRDLETTRLVAMHDRVTDAVQLSYEDDDKESLRILLPLEGKIVQVLHERV